MNKFKVGDIVQQINWYHTVPSIISGVIEEVKENYYFVRWDTNNELGSITEEHIELVSESYKKFREKYRSNTNVKN